MSKSKLTVYPLLIRTPLFDADVERVHVRQAVAADIVDEQHALARAPVKASPVAAGAGPGSTAPRSPAA